MAGIIAFLSDWEGEVVRPERSH